MIQPAKAWAMKYSHREVNAEFFEGNFLREQKIKNWDGIHESGKARD
jgi:hypothetical protein